MASVLLTGATGFIGSHVARELLRRGHRVTASVRPESDRRRILDIESRLSIRTGPVDIPPIHADIVIHAAWYAVPGKYLSAAENEACLEAGRRLLRAVQGRAVFVGSCFEYGVGGALREDAQTKPGTLYAECKDALRKDVEKRADSAWVRLFYQYGPWEDARRLVPAVINAQLKGEPSNVTLGLRRLDHLHVEDVASAICAVSESRLQGCVNIGSGIATSVRAIVTRLAVTGGRPDLIEWGAYQDRPGDPEILLADNQKLRSTGWSPRFDLEEGLRHTFEWWRSHLDPAHRMETR